MLYATGNEPPVCDTRLICDLRSIHALIKAIEGWNVSRTNEANSLER